MKFSDLLYVILVILYHLYLLYLNLDPKPYFGATHLMLLNHMLWFQTEWSMILGKRFYFQYFLHFMYLVYTKVSGFGKKISRKPDIQTNFVFVCKNN